MGTHPIFESDFDCLTECLLRRKKITCIRKEKNVKIRIRNPHAKEYLEKMYNSNELPKRRKIEPDEFADLLCSGEMVMIREPDIEKHPKHRIYRYSPKDIFVYQPKKISSSTQTSWPPDACPFDPEEDFIPLHQLEYVKFLEQTLAENRKEISDAEKEIEKLRFETLNLFDNYNRKCRKNELKLEKEKCFPQLQHAE